MATSMPRKPPSPAVRSWYSIAEAAIILGVNQRTIHRLIARGELPAVRLGRGRTVRIAVADLDRVLVPVPAGRP